MARYLTAANTEYLSRAAPVTAPPWSVSINFNVASYSAGFGRTLIDWTRPANPNQYVMAWINGGTGAMTLSKDGSDADYVTTTTGVVSKNVWHNIVLVMSSWSSFKLYLDGGSPATISDSTGTFTSTHLHIGAYDHGAGITLPFDGALAEVGHWNVALTASDVATLGALRSPLFVPRGLVAYWPLGGVYDADDGDHDIVGGYALTPYNTPTTADHPGGVLYPSMPVVTPHLTVSSVRPWYYHHRNRMRRAM